MASFTVQYTLDKRSPRQILPDGTEEYPDDAGQWALFQQVEEARLAAAEAVVEEQQDQDTAPIIEQRTAQPVIDKLFAARGELDVVFDLIATIEQQQFISLSHVPTAKNPGVVAQHAALSLARRKEQLLSTAERIRTGTAAARDHAHIADRFLQDLKEIRKQWRLCRRTSSSGGSVAGSFYVDLSLPIEKRGGKYIVESSSGRGSESADTEVNIVPSAEGIACVVVLVESKKKTTTAAPNAGAHPLPVKVIKGPENISEELQRRYTLHSWQVMEKLLSQEAKTNSGGGGRGTSGSTSGAAAAVFAILKMAAVATAKRAEIVHIAHVRTKNTENYGEDIAMLDAEEAEAVLTNKKSFSSAGAFSIPPVLSSAEKGLAAKDIETYCSTFTSQLEFEARALRCLASLCKDAQTPTLIKETFGGGGGGISTNTSSILEQLTSWLRHAALCYAVEQSITRQMSEHIALTSTPTAAASHTKEAERKWAISKNSQPVGSLAVESGVLRWYAVGITGQGQELGRVQLETFLEKNC